MSQPVLVSCPGCETSYDVSRRSPGKRMRCPRCKAVVVVPDRVAQDAGASPALTSSGRLRRARGPSCAVHPKRTAEGRCAGCQAYACETCWAPAPVDHFCATCAAARGLKGALPVDFGLLATPALAMRILLQTLPRTFLWTILSIVMSFLVFSIPIALSAVLFQAVYDPGNPPTWLSEAAALLVVCFTLAALGTHFLLLVPSGCAVFLDEAVRGERRPLVVTFREAWRRFVANAGRLVSVLLVVALLYVPYLFLALGAAYFTREAMGEHGNAWAAALLLVALPVGFLPLLTAFGLAVPIVILEERSAGPALARAWELVRPHLVAFGLLVLGYYALIGVIAVLLAVVGAVLDVPRLTSALSTFIDVLLWPSLLVAAYHGLAAERAGVLGRR